VTVDRDAAGAWVVEAGEQFRDRRLACARAPDERDGRPRRDLEVEVVEHVREVAVAEAHVLEVDTPLDRRELAGVGGVDDLGLLVEYREDPVERRRRREEGVVELRELLDGVEEVREVERAVAIEERTSTAGK
jgi:hypothetical protein